MDIAGEKEIHLVGCIGTGLFSILSLCSFIGFFRSPFILFTRLFFFSIFLSSFFDIPRYLSMILTSKYQSTFNYSLHILGNYFFFLSLTLVCLVWAYLLDLGSYSSFLFKGKGTIITNIILGSLSIITFCFCFQANSLSLFLKSLSYYIYIFVEVFENLFYSVSIAFLGIKLVLRSFIFFFLFNFFFVLIIKII